MLSGWRREQEYFEVRQDRCEGGGPGLSGCDVSSRSVDAGAPGFGGLLGSPSSIAAAPAVMCAARSQVGAAVSALGMGGRGQLVLSGR